MKKPVCPYCKKPLDFIEYKAIWEEGQPTVYQLYCDNMNCPVRPTMSKGYPDLKSAAEAWNGRGSD